MIKFCVIGCGNRSYLAIHLLEDSNATISAGCDPYAENMEKFRSHIKEHHYIEINAYSDYKEMIEKEKPDAIVIASPDHAHEEQAIYALKRGIAVYLEKPLSIEIESCDKILKIAKEHKAKIQIGHNMRYIWFPNKMKEIIDSGAIGDVQAIWVRHFVSYGDGYFRKWYSKREHINSLLVQKGAHDIDIIHMLGGAYAKRVSGYGKISVYDKLPRRESDYPVPYYKDRTVNWPHEKMKDFSPEISINDHNMIMMELSNGIQASYMQCFYTPDTCRNYTVIGTRGRIENYGDFGGKCAIQVWNTREEGFRREGDITYREPKRNESGHGGGDRNIMFAFLNYVRGEGKPLIRPQDARYAAACGIMGAESIRNGNMPMEVPILSDELENYDFH